MNPYKILNKPYLVTYNWITADCRAIPVKLHMSLNELINFRGSQIYGYIRDIRAVKA